MKFMEYMKSDSMLDVNHNPRDWDAAGAEMVQFVRDVLEVLDAHGHGPDKAVEMVRAGCELTNKMDSPDGKWGYCEDCKHWNDDREYCNLRDLFSCNSDGCNSCAPPEGEV